MDLNAWGGFSAKLVDVILEAVREMTLWRSRPAMSDLYQRGTKSRPLIDFPLAQHASKFCEARSYRLVSAADL